MNNPETTKVNYLFIDYENVQPTSFELLKKNPFKILLFIGVKQTKLPIELVTSLHALGKNVEYVKIKNSGKNALDFHIAFYLGKCIEKNPQAYFHILSKDSGFDILIQHLKAQKILIQRHEKLQDIPSLKAKITATPDEKIALIVDFLIKRENAKPRKIEALTNTIHALFKKSLTQQELQALVKKLMDKKLITLEDTKVHYNLN